MGLFGSTAQPGTSQQHLAEYCKDDYCPRLPCRMFKAGYEKGFADGWAAKPPEIIYVTVSSGSG